MHRSAKKFSDNNSGATLVELALVSPIFFLILFVIIEYGLVMFSSVVVESAVMHGSRAASLGKGQDSAGACSNTANRADYVKCVVREKTGGLIHANSIIVDANKVVDGGVPASRDICLLNDVPTVGGPCPQGTLWQDVNGNGVYDAGPGQMTDASLGNAGELVELRVYYPWKVQIPFVKEFFGCHSGGVEGCQEGVIMITSATLLKNEPFN